MRQQAPRADHGDGDSSSFLLGRLVDLGVRHRLNLKAPRLGQHLKKQCNAMRSECRSHRPAVQVHTGGQKISRTGQVVGTASNQSTPDLTLVIAAVSVVLPWPTCPMVPTFTWGFLQHRFARETIQTPVQTTHETRNERERGRASGSEKRGLEGVCSRAGEGRHGPDIPSSSRRITQHKEGTEKRC